MKKVFVLLLALMPALLFAQKPGYTLSGKTGNLSAPARAYLFYKAGGKTVIDSTGITNGVFSFHGSLAEPVSAYLVMDPTGMGSVKLQKTKDKLDLLIFYLENSNIVLTAADSVSKAQVTGSKLNDDDRSFKAMLEPFRAREAVIAARVNSANDATKINPFFTDSVKAAYNVIEAEETTAIQKFVYANPKSYMSLLAIQLLLQSGMSINASEPLYNSLAPNVQQSELGKGFASAIAQVKIGTVGTQAPDFTQPDTSGTPLKLSSLKGKYVLLDFWASWSEPSRTDNAHLLKVFNRYKYQNFTILGVSLDKAEQKNAWIKAIKDDNITWPQVSDLKYRNNEAAVLFKVFLVPQNFLIDPQGKIIAKSLSGPDLDAKLAEIFKM